MLSRRSFALSLAAFTLLPALAEARERGELLRSISERRKGGAQAERGGKRGAKALSLSVTALQSLTFMRRTGRGTCRL